MDFLTQLTEFNQRVQERTYLPKWLRDESAALAASYTAQPQAGAGTQDHPLAVSSGPGWGAVYIRGPEDWPTWRPGCRAFRVYGAGEISYTTRDGSVIDRFPVVGRADYPYAEPIQVSMVNQSKWSAYPVLFLY